MVASQADYFYVKHRNFRSEVSCFGRKHQNHDFLMIQGEYSYSHSIPYSFELRKGFFAFFWDAL